MAAYISGRFGPPTAREQEVADVREHLQEAEDPQRVAEPGERRDPAADERADDRRHHADRGERDAAVVRAVAHVDQERPRQRLRELVGELVEQHEREDLERAMPREEARGTGCQTASRSVLGAAVGSSGSGAFHVRTSIGT